MLKETFINWSSLYSKSSCSINIGNSQTRSFWNSRDVRQGCILSPLLFNLYDDYCLLFSFESTFTDPFVLPNGTSLNPLSYEDVSIDFHDQKQDFKKLRYSHITDRGFSTYINLKKTKVMVCQRRVRKYDLTFLNENIDKNYTYLSWGSHFFYVVLSLKRKGSSLLF